MTDELAVVAGPVDIGPACLMTPRPIDAPSKLLAGSFASSGAFLPAPQETLTNGDCRPHSEPAAFLSRDRTAERVAARQNARAHRRQYGRCRPEPRDSADGRRIHACAASLSDRLLHRPEPHPDGAHGPQ